MQDIVNWITKQFDGVTLTLFSVMGMAIGSVIGIKFHKPKTRGEAFIVMLTGFGVAAFVGYPLTTYLRITEPAAAGIHFLTAIGGMYILMGFIVLFRRFSRKPIETMRNLKSLDNGSDNETPKIEDEEVI